MQLRHELSQYFAEFIGTFFLVFFGCGAVILSQIDPANIDPLAIPLVFGGIISVMIYAVGHISGAHFNPAVTLAFCLAKKFPAFRIPGYFISQFLGATLASFLHRLIWFEGHDYGMTILSVPLGAGLALEMIFSFALMFVIMSVATDSRAIGELAGIAIGSIVAVCAYVGGPLTGASMNPARSFGPAFMMFDFIDYWLFLLAPFVGAAFGALSYEWIRCQKKAENESGHGCC